MSSAADLDRDMSSLELADLFEITDRAVRDLAQRGILTKTARGRYPLVESVRAYTAHLREEASARGGGKGLTDERQRATRERADHLALRNAQARRELVSVIETEAAWSEILRRVRSRSLAVPSRCRQRLPHLTAQDAEAIDREIRDALTELGTDASRD